jgi:hypothetical protein
MTSHLRTLSKLFLPSTGTSSTCIHLKFWLYDLALLVCVQRRSDTLLVSCYCQAIPCSHPFVPTILVSHPLNLMASSVVFQSPPPAVITG